MKQNKNILKNPGVQSLLTSLLCILLGLFIGYLVLLLINPTGAWGAITNVMKNFLTYSSAKAQLKYLGNTLVRTAPLLMCSLSVLFVYKVGLFNIGATGQYVAGACACLYAALYLHWHWLPCMLLAIAAGALPERGKQLPLAVVAAVRPVGRRAGHGQDVRLDDRHGDVQLSGEPPGVRQLKGRLEGGLHIVRMHIAPIGFGCPQQER